MVFKEQVKGKCFQIQGRGKFFTSSSSQSVENYYIIFISFFAWSSLTQLVSKVVVIRKLSLRFFRFHVGLVVKMFDGGMTFVTWHDRNAWRTLTVKMHFFSSWKMRMWKNYTKISKKINHKKIENSICCSKAIIKKRVLFASSQFWLVSVANGHRFFLLFQQFLGGDVQLATCKVINLQSLNLKSEQKTFSEIHVSRRIRKLSNVHLQSSIACF